MTMELQDRMLKIQTPFFRRNIDLSSGPHSCEVFTRSPESSRWVPHHHLNPAGIPFEAAVKLDGAWLEAGPHKHKTEFWKERGGAFHVADVVLSQGRFGPKAAIVCRPASGQMPQVELAVEYEVSEALPFFRKSARATNTGRVPFSLQNICPDIFYGLRAGSELMFLHDFRQQTETGDTYYLYYVRHQFPRDIDLTLMPGETAESFNLYTVATPNHQEGRSVWTQRVLKHAAPWLARTYVSLQCGGIRPRADMSGPEQFRRLADDCAQAGVEKVTFFVGQWWTNTGDYEIRRDLFPNGEADLRAAIDYYHAKGIKVGPYTSYSIACHDTRVRKEHLDWECVGAEGQRFYPAGLGNMCFLSGFGDFILEKYRWMVERLGVDEIFIDGPTDIPCFQKGHGHANENDYEYRNWLWEKAFLQWARDRDIFVDIPRGPNYLMMGACALPGGYTEQDYCHCSGMDQIVNSRARLYQARFNTPACCTWAMACTDAYHRHSLELDEERPWLYEHALAGMFGYGHPGALYGARLWCGPRTKETLIRWIAFYKRFRDTLSGDFLHLIPPDGEHPDAVLHTNPAARAPAVAVFINPAAKGQKINAVLPLHYAGFQPGANVKSADGLEIELDDRAAAPISVALGPYEVKTIALTRDVKCVLSKP